MSTTDEMLIEVNGEGVVLDPSGALWWPEQSTLVFADIHFEKGSFYALGGQFLPPYDTRTTLRRIQAAVAARRPARVIALGDSFHDRKAADRLDEMEREALLGLGRAADWIWIAGNHDPALSSDLGGVIASEVCIGPIAFRHEPTGAYGEIAGHLHPKARVATRSRVTERRCFASDGERAVMPAFGAYAGGLSIRDRAFTKIFGAPDFMAHVLGDTRLHAIVASRCY